MSEETKTDDQVKEEIRAEVEAGEKTKQETPEFESVEAEARSIGWHPEGKNKLGITVSPEQFIQEKPLYDTIGKLKTTLGRLDEKVSTLQNDAKTSASYFIKEKETLRNELKEAREQALTNLEVDDVRKLDKQIETVQEEIDSAPQSDYVSPYYDAFLEDNEWAGDDSDVRTLTSESIAIRYNKLNPKAGDKELYDHIHKEIREKFPEKFEGKKPSQKVASTSKRTTNTDTKKKAVTLADLDPEEQHIVRVMIDSTGMSEEDYMKNYSTEAIR